MNYREIQEDLIKRYRIKLNPDSDCWGRMHAHVKTRTVCKWRHKNSVVATFDLMHETGHIETTKAGMRRAESEFYATKWALERAEEYGVEIPAKIVEGYQDYIDMEKARGERRGGSGYGELQLVRRKGFGYEV